MDDNVLIMIISTVDNKDVFVVLMIVYLLFLKAFVDEV